MIWPIALLTTGISIGTQGILFGRLVMWLQLRRPNTHMEEDDSVGERGGSGNPAIRTTADKRGPSIGRRRLVGTARRIRVKINR
jgi:hypothetical protein